MSPVTSGIQQELYEVCRTSYNELIEFVSSEPFQNVYSELMSLPPKDRPQFVVDVLLDDDQLRKRGVNRPPQLLIQRSAFGDRRPTLFCVKKWLPSHLHEYWENVNVTFDNEFEPDTIPKDSTAWRPPLPVQLQHHILSGDIDEETADKVINLMGGDRQLSL